MAKTEAACKTKDSPRPYFRAGSRMDLAVAGLAMRHPDGSYLYPYLGDKGFLTDLYGDVLSDPARADRSITSLSGQTRKIVGKATEHLRRLDQGTHDPVGEHILDIIHRTDSKNESLTVEDAIDMISRGNPEGKRMWHNTKKQGPRTRRRPARQQTETRVAHSIDETQTRRERHVQTYGFSDRASIQLNEQEIADVMPKRKDSVVSHRLWPAENLTQLEKYTYALELPGEDGQWHFQDLTAAVSNINAASLEVDLNGEALTAEEREEKIRNMVEGARITLRTYILPVIMDNIRYYHDPIHNLGTPDLARRIFDWLKKIPEDKRPTLETFLKRLGDAVE